LNTFKEILKLNQSRLLNLYNLDEFSSTLGIGDRKYWAWKTIDFPNATFQSGINALGISIKLGISDDDKLYFEIIDKIIRAIPGISNRNNSLNESFPGENSYCVTALIAYDVLFTIDLLKDKLGNEKKKSYIKIIEPLINFLIRNREAHAIISNHLATAAAALYLWTELTHKNKNKYKDILDIIYKNQSSEGWFMEYDGPDPGYQTLCTQYLSIIFHKTKDNELKRRLSKSIEFLYYFIHPDGSIGGLYGSRNTEVYYPGGIVLLDSISKYSNHVNLALKRGIDNGFAIMPQDIDPDNFIPLLNSYALAALYENKISTKKDLIKPFYILKNKKNFKEAGIEVFSNKNYFSILNYKKGGTLKVYDLSVGKCKYDSGGVLYLDKKILTSQRFDKNISMNKDNTFMSKLYYYEEKYPSLFQTILIRIMSITIFRVSYIVELFKKAVVKLLITNKKKSKFLFKTNIKYEEENIQIIYEFPKNLKKECIHLGFKFKSIHMASSGYFIKSNIISNNNEIVKLILR